MFSLLFSAALQGIGAVPVQVEVNADESGEPRLILIGLPDAAVKESDDRVCSALENAGFEPVRTRTTINLAPGELRKEGAIYDLPIALAILVATGQLRCPDIGDYLIAGELSLSGSVRPVRGALAMAQLARRLGKRGLILPPGSAEEAALTDGVAVYRVASLRQTLDFLSGEDALVPVTAAPLPPSGSEAGESAADFSEIKGQIALRRAVEVAVAGGHNLLIVGPPGSGKSMVAKRIPGIMPPPTKEETLEIRSIRSIAGLEGGGSARPFRAPHHTVSDIALLGGGAIPGPGEVSLAHHGVLFLDELPEFKRSALEVLRQPLEDGTITISRSAGRITLPCVCMVVAAMNPCPCGHLGDSRRACRCAPAQIQRYRGKISGPLLDRMDLHVEAPVPSLADLRSEAPGEASAAIRARVLAARERQQARGGLNARLGPTQLRRFCALSPALGDRLEQAMEKLSFSARAYDRILKVARTIADLAGAEAIEAAHLFEAIQYRTLDRDVFR